MLSGLDALRLSRRRCPAVRGGTQGSYRDVAAGDSSVARGVELRMRSFTGESD